MKVEIQKVPVHQKPEKPDTADREQRVPDLVPNPLRRIEPGFDRGHDGDEGADPDEKSDDLQQMEPEVALGSWMGDTLGVGHIAVRPQLLENATSWRMATPVARCREIEPRRFHTDWRQTVGPYFRAS